MADSRKTLLAEVSAQIPASSTVVVDSTPLDCFSRLDFWCVFSDATANKKFLNLSVFKADTGLATQVSGRHGAALSFTIEAFLNGLDAEIRVQNFEAFAVNLVASKLTT